MKEKQLTKQCNKCLLSDHVAANCTNPVVCLGCLKPGHKQAYCSEPFPGTANGPSPTPLSQQQTEKATDSDSVFVPPPDTPTHSQDPEIIPPTQNSKDAEATPTENQREKSDRKQTKGAEKEKHKKKKQTKIHQVLDAVFHTGTRAQAQTKRPLQRSSSSELEGEQDRKRAAQMAHFVIQTHKSKRWGKWKHRLRPDTSSG